MKISEWLKSRVQSHAIQDHAELSADFTKETGHPACWPSHTPEVTRAMIDARGLGGSLSDDPAPLLCYGWEVAAALAITHASYRSMKIGRGGIFRDCIEVLEQVNK
jgi:hypothetical protein